MIKKTAKAIHRLRFFFLFVLPFCFFFVLGLNPIDVGQLLSSKIGKTVGMSVGVAENEYNKIAMQLDAKQDELNEREKKLNEIETKIEDSYYQQKGLVLFLTIGFSVLFILVILNFYFDYKRKKISKL